MSYFAISFANAREIPWPMKSRFDQDVEMKTYSNGTYSVTINSDRSIRVRPGDWISKYSAAIHDDPMAHWGDYKRKVNGKFVNITNGLVS